MSNRYSELKSILHSQKCFKMICGAGNEDAPQVEKLSFVYTLAGAKILDVSANVDVVKHAISGIDKAFDFAKEKPSNRPFIMVSIGMPGDHHVRKSYIDPVSCIGCALCIPICPTDAIPKGFTKSLDFFRGFGGSFDDENQANEIVTKDLCIGCGKCSSICPKEGVISYRHNSRELRELLPKCMDSGAELFELHAAVKEDDVSLAEWALINEINPNNYNSMCLDRLNLGNLTLENRISRAREISSERLIIQADGYPMSGGEDDYNTTLQAVACSDVVNKKFNMQIDKRRTVDAVGNKKISSKKTYKPINAVDNVPIILSGGTNSLSKKLADLTGVRINGVAIGTFARDIIEKEVSSLDFWTNDEVKSLATQKATELVNANN